MIMKCFLLLYYYMALPVRNVVLFQQTVFFLKSSAAIFSLQPIDVESMCLVLQAIILLICLSQGLGRISLGDRIKENDEFRCNIEKRDVKEMMRRDFIFPSHPVIYSYSINHNSSKIFNFADYPISKDSHAQPDDLFEKSSLSSLYELHGETAVILSSSNTYSHGRIDTTLQDYLENIMPGLFPRSSNLSLSSKLLANESYYLFGHNYHGIWAELSDLYRPPPCHLCDKAGAKTIGIGGRRSGVSFHFHGSGFSEVLHGTKSWYLFPPQHNVRITKLFHANMTVDQWHEVVYPLFADYYSTRHSESFSTTIPRLDGEASPLTPLTDSPDDALRELLPHLYECTISRGEILYFPAFWMHGTLNRDEYNVFFSHFLDLQLMKE